MNLVTSQESRLQFTNPILVVGNGLTALKLVRYFGKLGADVSVLSENIGEANFSRYTKRNIINHKIGDHDILRRSLERIKKIMNKRPVIYPTSDMDALNLSSLKEDLSDDFHFVVSNEKSVRLLVNKSEFYKALEEQGLKHPTTYYPLDISDAQRIAAELEYPVFVRPSITQLFNKTIKSGSKGFVAYSPKQLINFYRITDSHRISVMFQEIIPGPPSNSYQIEGYYNKYSSPLILFARQRLRIWPTDFGNTTLCTSIPIKHVNQESKQVNQFLKKIGYNGVMSAEFKKDERDGLLKLLEINTRPWWHFWLSSECGVPIILTSYFDVIGEKLEYKNKYDVGVKSIHLPNDLRTTAFHIPRRTLSLANWFSSIRNIKTFAYIEKGDLTPLYMTFMQQGIHFLKNNFTLKKNSG